MVFAMTTTPEPGTDPAQTTITTTIKQQGPGQLTFNDLFAFVHSCSDANIGAGTPVRVEQSGRYDRTEQAMIYDGWELSATGVITLKNRPSS